MKIVSFLRYVVNRLGETSTQASIMQAIAGSVVLEGPLRVISIIVGVIGAVLPTTSRP